MVSETQSFRLTKGKTQVERGRTRTRHIPCLFLCLNLFLVLLCSSCSKDEPCSTCPPNNTPDTTSHDFIWTIDTLGDGNGSTLNDVAIINDTLAYAVGEIYLKDSTGQFESTPHNFVSWNGGKWTVRIVTVSFRGNLITPPLEGIYCSSPTQVWLVGSLPIYGDGSSWTMYDLRTAVDPNISVSKAWGSTPTDMYFVGRAGSIAHYDRVSWQKLSSGTSLDIYDIWGDGNEVYAVAAKQFVNFDKKVLRIRGTQVDSVSASGIDYSLQSLWFKSGQRYFVVGDGIFSKEQIQDTTTWKSLHTEVTTYHTYVVRGQALNDIFVAGSFGEMLHYNGSSWKSYRATTAIALGAFHGLAFKNDLIIAVGQESPRGIVAVGRRRQ
ncbi:MAG: hypothetical protein WBD36_06420 [Bacteroidota bacterium]